MVRRYALLSVAAFVFSVVGPIGSFARCVDLSGEGPVQLIVALDRTQSVPPSQASWLALIHPLLSCIRPGDQLRLLEINADSAQTPALADDNLPVAGPDAPLLVQIEVRNHAIKSRKETEDAFRSLLSTPGDAQATDILSIFDRVRPQSGVKTLIVLFTDGLESSREDHLDLEKTPVTPKLIETVLPVLAQRHGWTPTTLAGVSCYFVLPKTEGRRENQQVNNPQALTLFYRSLITALGGSLAGFSVDLAGVQPQGTNQLAVR